jgi:DNA-binding FadR family transcriptional regulator
MVVKPMGLTSVHAASLADGLFREIAGQVLDGTLPAGANLPAERTLAETHGINRHAVREAIKRAEQIGLVRSRQGGGTTVLDFRQTAGLDALALLAEYATEDLAGARLWRAGLEMRSAIGCDIARLCAIRADRQTRAELISLSEQMRAAREDAALAALDQQFWLRMIDGADNIAYRLAFNSLMQSARFMVERQVDWTIKELENCDFRLPIAEAIAAGDPAAAEAATKTSLQGAIEAIDAAIDQLEQATKVA